MTLLAACDQILIQPLAPLEPMQQFSLWLGPLQGLVAAAPGAFFVKAD